MRPRAVMAIAAAMMAAGGNVNPLGDQHRREQKQKDTPPTEYQEKLKARAEAKRRRKAERRGQISTPDVPRG